LYIKNAPNDIIGILDNNL